MSNTFKDIAKGVANVERRFLGETYNYAKQIRNPNELRISPRGSLGQLTTNIQGIMAYIEQLVSGQGRGSRVGGPLGNRFFLRTMGECKDYKTGKTVPRSMFINNIPQGHIPVISDITGFRSRSLRGLAPGVAGNMSEINPVRMFSAFMQGAEPLCAEVSLQTRDTNNRQRVQKGYIPLFELRQLLNGGQISKEDRRRRGNEIIRNDRDLNRLLNRSVETETFLNMCDSWNGFTQPEEERKEEEVSWIKNAYLFSFTLLLMYLFFKLSKK